MNTFSPEQISRLITVTAEYESLRTGFILERLGADGLNQQLEEERLALNALFGLTPSEYKLYTAQQLALEDSGIFTPLSMATSLDTAESEFANTVGHIEPVEPYEVVRVYPDGITLLGPPERINGLSGLIHLSAHARQGPASFGTTKIRRLFSSENIPNQPLTVTAQDIGALILTVERIGEVNERLR